MEWRIASRATDVTDQFIKGPPGSASKPKQVSGRRDSGLKVFIAHSGESGALHRLTRFLRALEAEPQIAEWLPSSGAQVPDSM